MCVYLRLLVRRIHMVSVVFVQFRICNSISFQNIPKIIHMEVKPLN